MRIRACGEHGKERLDHRVIPGEPVAARPVERGCAGVEGDLERRGVLPRDPVPGGCESHHFEQCHRRLVRDILRVRPSKSTWRRSANRRVHVARVVYTGRFEHPAQRAAKKGPRGRVLLAGARRRRLIDR